MTTMLNGGIVRRLHHECIMPTSTPLLDRDLPVDGRSTLSCRFWPIADRFKVGNGFSPVSGTARVAGCKGRSAWLKTAKCRDSFPRRDKAGAGRGGGHGD